MRDKSFTKGFILGLAILLAGVFASANGASGTDEGTIPVVGLDENNNEQKSEFSQKEYIKNSGLAVATVYDSIMPALIQTENSKPSKWGLRLVAVGLGVTTEFGIGPVKVGAIPKIRLMFTNHINPPLP